MRTKIITLDQMITIAEILGYEIGNLYENNEITGHWLMLPEIELQTEELFDSDEEWNTLSRSNA